MYLCMQYDSGSIFGAAITGFCATLGAPTGLRQISVSRYSMGWYPNKVSLQYLADAGTRANL